MAISTRSSQARATVAASRIGQSERDRLQKAGIRKGYGSLQKQGISIQASTSHLDDDRYTKAQHDIRGGV